MIQVYPVTPPPRKRRFPVPLSEAVPTWFLLLGRGLAKSCPRPSVGGPAGSCPCSSVAGPADDSLAHLAGAPSWRPDRHGSCSLVGGPTDTGSWASDSPLAPRPIAATDPSPVLRPTPPSGSSLATRLTLPRDPPFVALTSSSSASRGSQPSSLPLAFSMWVTGSTPYFLSFPL